jgi:mRNA-degrading endonuclease RelE of RelBE toxin-antitoxin system
VTDKQPKALWLADELEKYTYDFEWHSTAADELRRLHEMNAELVEALKAALSDDQPYIERCKAALVKATGENNG